VRSMSEQQAQARGVSNALQAQTSSQSTNNSATGLTITIPAGDTAMSEFQIPALDSMDFLDDILQDVDPLKLPPVPHNGLVGGESWDFELSDCPLPTPSSTQCTLASQDDPFDMLDYGEGSQTLSYPFQGRCPPLTTVTSSGPSPVKEPAIAIGAGPTTTTKHNAIEPSMPPPHALSGSNHARRYFTTNLFPNLFPFVRKEDSQAVCQYINTAGQTSSIITSAMISLGAYYQRAQLGRFGIIRHDLECESTSAGRSATEGMERRLRELKLRATVPSDDPAALEIQLCALLTLLSLVSFG
jgi:hypothetical protein